MFHITAIERSGNTCTVQFDDAPPLRCSRSFIRRLRLNAGQQIDPVLLERVRLTAAADLAERIAARLLNRPRSRREIAARLLQDGIPDSVVRDTLEHLELQALHNESDDALALARRCAGSGEQDWNSVRQRCGQRLRRRGFSAAVALRAVQLAWQEAQAGEEIREDRPDPPHYDLNDDDQIETTTSAKFRSPVR